MKRITLNFRRTLTQFRNEDVPVGSISIACYQPRPGREEELLELVRHHMEPLRNQGLVTGRTPIVMRTKSGTIVEVFEWVSEEAIAGAHSNPVVLDLWKKFEAVCWYETPSNIPEFQNMFSSFEPV
jgi:quinol monooxygenase YgiN